MTGGIGGVAVRRTSSSRMTANSGCLPAKMRMSFTSVTKSYGFERLASVKSLSAMRAHRRRRGRLAARGWVPRRRSSVPAVARYAITARTFGDAGSEARLHARTYSLVVRPAFAAAASIASLSSRVSRTSSRSVRGSRLITQAVYTQWPHTVKQLQMWEPSCVDLLAARCLSLERRYVG